MKSKIVMAMVLVFSFCGSSVLAADVKERFSVQEAMELEQVREMFPGDVAFYWGNQPHPPVSKKYGTFKTSKRTNAFGKTRDNACSWAMASSLLALQDRAYREGGNAVINIVSNISNHEESSDSEFSCLAGRVMVNVALKGKVVTLAR